MPRKQVKGESDWRVVSRLELTVNYDRVLSDSEVQELVEKARELGHPVKAKYTVLKTSSRDLI